MTAKLDFYGDDATICVIYATALRLNRQLLIMIDATFILHLKCSTLNWCFQMEMQPKLIIFFARLLMQVKL